MDLEAYRRRIDGIDAKIAALFEERLAIAEGIGRYKAEHGLPLFHEGREKEVLAKAKQHLANADFSREMEALFTAMMEISKNRQRRFLPATPVPTADAGTKVGYQGRPGSFSEEAAIAVFGESGMNGYETFEALFSALESGEIDEGVLPLENSSTGAIAQVYDLLLQYGFFIVGEKTLEIRQNLLARPGTKIGEIREVFSHPQGFAQSSLFLARYPEWRQIPYYNTAIAAKYVAERGRRDSAAIAGNRAAAIYGLEVIAADIQNNRDNNYTRFIRVRRELRRDRAANKASLVLSLEHEAGHLYRLLGHFAANGVNLVKIESRPMKNRRWKYFLYLDFEGDVYSPGAKEVMARLEADAGFFRLLGAYSGEA